MSNFDHVTSATVRDLCRGTMSATVPALAYALGYTAACLDQDAGDADILFEVIDARESAFEAAKSAFAYGDAAACLAALRRVWSI